MDLRRKTGLRERQALRRQKVIDYRLQGLSYRRIAEVVSKEGIPVSWSQVGRDVEQVMRETARATMRDGETEAYRQLLIERGEMLWERVLERTVAGDPRAIIAATRVLLTLARLGGLDRVTVIGRKRDGDSETAVGASGPPAAVAALLAAWAQPGAVALPLPEYDA